MSRNSMKSIYETTMYFYELRNAKKKSADKTATRKRGYYRSKYL